MKAGLTTLVIAMIEIKEADALPQGTLRLLVTTGEKSAQYGSKYLRENGYMGDIEAMIIAEPTGDVIDGSNLLIDKGEDLHFVVLGPGQTSSARQLDEYVSKEAYFNFVDIYIELITEFAEDK